MKNKKHIGTSFESFLEEARILEDVNNAAVKSVIAQNLKSHMEENNITHTKMAVMLETSRAGLERLLDPENYSVTLKTFNRAATILGKRVNISLVDTAKSTLKSIKAKKR